MCDLRGFTDLTNRLPPERVVRLLNHYLGAMAEVVASFGGTVDEFVGAAVLACFGAPIGREDDALRAVACALHMQQAMSAVNERNWREGLPEIVMGVAVHTGPVVVGNVGCATRAKYSAVGAAVNLTARLEACTVGGDVLISESTLESAGPFVDVGESTRLEVKGFDRPITAYSVMGVPGPYSCRLHGQAPLTLHPIDPGLETRCAVIQDKQVRGEEFDARILRLSSRGAELLVSRGLRTLTDLRLRVAGASGDIYAKVLEVSEDHTCRVRFTAVAPAADAVLRAALGEA